MPDLWYPDAVRNVASTDGGSHLGPVEIGVLHTTEGEFVPRANDYFGHTSYPHFTVDVDNGECIVYQHIPLNRAARALENRSGGVQTNREGVIQVEVVGRAAEPFTRDPVLVAGLSRLMRWIEANTQIPRRAAATFWAGKYGVDVPHRLSGAQWTAAKGWLGHQHVAENAHYDPGAIDIAALLTGTSEEDDMPLTDDDIDRIAARVWGQPLQHRTIDAPAVIVAVDTLLSAQAAAGQTAGLHEAVAAAVAEVAPDVDTDRLAAAIVLRLGEQAGSTPTTSTE